MQKETLIAVLIGLILGLFVTYGLYQFKRSVTTPPPTEIVAEPTETKDEAELSSLQVTSPEDGLIQVENQLTVAGQASQPNSYIVVFVGNVETILQSDAAGNFSTTVDLKDGGNVITVASIDQDGKVTKVERVVAVSSAFEISQSKSDNNSDEVQPEQAQVDKTATKTAQAEIADEIDGESTESTTQAILDRINKKLSEEQQDELAKTIEKLAVKRRALIGQIERVTEESLTLTTTAGTVILPIDADTTIKKGNQKVAINNVAVEDWALVMGMSDETTIKPEQILISTTSLRPNPQIVMIGTIAQIDTGSITVVNRDGTKEEELTIDRNTNYENVDGKTAKLSQFSTDLTVLVVGQEKAVKTETQQLVTTLKALAAFAD